MNKIPRNTIKEGRMLYSYQEVIDLYKSDFQLKKAVLNGYIYKIEDGIYSTEEYVSELSIINKKYPDAIFTLNSAFFYHGLTDVIPNFYYLKIAKNKSIHDSRVKVVYENSAGLELGVMRMDYGKTNIKIYNKERLLIELIRNKNKLPFDYYKEILGNYRKIIHQLDIQMIQELAYELPKTNIILETLQMEVL